MTVTSTHLYTAENDLGTVVTLRDGRAELDSSGYPHVTGDVVVGVENAALLDELDPRDSHRLVITASRDGGTPRPFDLGIRKARPNRKDGTVALQLASDEAILDEFGQAVDDNTPRTHETSLRAIVNYVLGKISATLQAGTDDANVTAYWAVTNLLLNPSVEGTLNNWSAAGNCTIFHATAPRTGTNACGFTSSAAGVLAVSPMLLSGKLSVSAGKSYVFDGYGRRFTNYPAGSTIRAAIRWVDANGGSPWPDVLSPAVALNTTYDSRAVVIARAPAGAVAAFPFFQVTGATASGQIGYVDDAMFHEGTEAIPVFTGSTAPTSAYTYTWAQAANASTSTRTPVVERSPDLLVWRAGHSGMAFLDPLLKVAGLRLVCDEQRRWTLRNADYRADGNQTYRNAGNIKDADEELSRDADEWFDAAVYVYTWTDDDGIEQTRTDSYSAVPTPTKTIRVEVAAPFPGPGRAEHMVTRAQGRGRTVTVTSIPTWTEQTDQALSILLEDTPIQTGIAGTVTYDFGADTVAVTSRTTDTPAAAWILVPAGERWIDSPVGESWTEEII